MDRIAQFAPARQQATDAYRQSALVENVTICQNTDQFLNDAHQFEVRRRQFLERCICFVGIPALIFIAFGVGFAA